MRCDDVQDQAGAWLDHEVSESTAAEIAAHQADCPACRAFIADLRLFSEEVSRLEHAPAPGGLEDRIRAALADEQKRAILTPVRPVSLWSGWARQAAALAAVCLLSISGTWAFLRGPEGGSIAGHDAVAAHVRSLLQNNPTQVLSSDQHTVRPWFNGKVEFAPPVTDLTAEGFHLIGGRLDFVDGRRVAALVYQRRLHMISVFVWPGTVGMASSEARSAGLNVLSWTKDGMVWWAVSDVGMVDLRELRDLL